MGSAINKERPVPFPPGRETFDAMRSGNAGGKVGPESEKGDGEQHHSQKGELYLGSEDNPNSAKSRDKEYAEITPSGAWADSGTEKEKDVDRARLTEVSRVDSKNTRRTKRGSKGSLFSTDSDIRQYDSIFTNMALSPRFETCALTVIVMNGIWIGKIGMGLDR